MADLDVVVVGCGIVGASVAFALGQRNRDVTIVEKAHHSGHETSSRNSGVIHAGLYYPPGSLKAELCRLGRDMIYDFCANYGVPCEKTGKFIVANGPEEEAYLSWLLENAKPTPLYRVDQGPSGIRASAALFSPESGVVDQHALIDALLLQSGATVLLDQTVEGLAAISDGAEVRVSGDITTAKTVINCAGLQAATFVPGYQHAYAKGSYFSVRHPALKTLTSLVYPAIPKTSPSLGIHLVRTFSGEWYLGPDFQWVDSIDYGVDPTRAGEFARAAEVSSGSF